MASAPKPPKPIVIFCGYAHADQKYRDQLKTFLSFLVHDKKIEFWFDGIIMPGRGWDDEIKRNLNKANLIVFLVSPDFLASEYAYTVELRRALERRQAGEAEVVPVIIRHCPWDLTFAQHLQALPTGLLPIKKWEDPDEAWTDVARGLWRVVEELRAKTEKEGVAATTLELVAPAPPEMPAKLKPKDKATPAELPTQVVDAKGGADYKTINEAMAVAKTGATIKVRPGEYREGLVLDKEVEIIGDGPRDEIVVISRDSDCVSMATEKARLVNLTLRCCAGELGKKFHGVDIPQGRLRLENCDISSDSKSCLAVYGPQTDPVVSNCIIHDGSQSGVVVYNDAKGVFEDCDIFGNAFGGVIVKTEGRPIFRRCKMHDGKQSGVFVYGKGQGVFEECEMFSNALSGVSVALEGNPAFKNCKIHDGKQVGVYVHEKGRGLFEECDILGNAYTGVVVTEEGSPTVKQCRINRNGYQGVWVREGSSGTFLDNDLTDNALGPWKIEAGCKVTRKGNRLKPH